jgi:c-di-GMP-binding flagellar brake protein YcgR
VKLRSLFLYARGKGLEEPDIDRVHAAGSMEPAEKAEELAAGRENLRTVPRFAVDEEARLLLVEHGSTLPCRIVDLSLSGCRIRTRERFPAGTKVRVEVTFKVRGLAFRFCGTTQWTDGRNLAGIRFVDVPARRKEDLAEAIGEVEAETAVKQAAAQLAAALEADPPPICKQDERPARPLSTVQAPNQAIAAQARPGLRSLFVLPWAGGAQRAATAESAAAGGNRLQTDSGPAQSGPSGQIPAEQPSPGTPQAGESQRDGLSPIRSSRRERRAQLREGVDTSAVVFLVNVASRLTGRILDLSLGGCRIRTDERFPVGIYTRIETEFLLEGLPFRLGGVIQAIHDRHNVGIRFLDMSSRKREQLEQLIEEIEEAKKQGTGNREQGIGNRE